MLGRIYRIAFAAGLSGISTAALAAGMPAANAELLERIVEASTTADVPALAGIYQSSDPVAHGLAAMALERVHGHFEQADRDAQVCEDSLFQSYPNIARFCARFRAGNWRLAGDQAKANAAEQALIDRFAPLLPAAQAAQLRAQGQTRMQEPLPQVTWPDAGLDIPLVSDQNREVRDAVVVKANGHEAKLVLDTGSDSLVMDAATARDLGVRLTDMHGRANGLLTHDMATQIGMLDDLDMSGVHIRHALVEIVPAEKRLIGLNVLKYLGAFRISKQGIHIYGQHEARPSGGDPMLLGSGLDGFNIKLAVALNIDGKPYVTLLDTGDIYYLSGNKAARTDLDTRFVGHMRLNDIGAGTHLAAYSRAETTVVVSGQPIRMQLAVFDEAQLPWSFILGRGALDDMDIYVDFPHATTQLILHDHLR